jgi:NAD+--asparagine ADP-ribosyltransferase
VELKRTQSVESFKSNFSQHSHQSLKKKENLRYKDISSADAHETDLESEMVRVKDKLKAFIGRYQNYVTVLESMVKRRVKP